MACPAGGDAGVWIRRWLRADARGAASAALRCIRAEERWGRTAELHAAGGKKSLALWFFLGDDVHF